MMKVPVRPGLISNWRKRLCFTSSFLLDNSPLEDAIVFSTCRDEVIIVLGELNIGNMARVSLADYKFGSFLNAGISKDLHLRFIIRTG